MRIAVGMSGGADGPVAALLLREAGHEVTGLALCRGGIIGLGETAEDREIRVAGGRERCLGPMQPLALFAADSMFTAGYLTAPGQGYEADRIMIAAAGFFVAEVEAVPS